MLTPSAAKWAYCATGGLTPVPLKDPSVLYEDTRIRHYRLILNAVILTTEKSYPAVLTPPKKPMVLVLLGEDEALVEDAVFDVEDVVVADDVAVPGRH